MSAASLLNALTVRQTYTPQVKIEALNHSDLGVVTNNEGTAQLAQFAMILYDNPNMTVDGIRD
jgi:hypothetical protein